MKYKKSTFNKYNRNVRSRCGPGNAYFISIRQVSLPGDFPYFATYWLIKTTGKSDTVRKSPISVEV